MNARLHAARTHLLFFLPLIVVALMHAQEPATTPITTLTSLRRDSTETRTSHNIDITATVWFADPANGHFILSDASGSAELQMDFDWKTFFPGDCIRIAGRGTVMNRGCAVEITRLAVVDNDGIHDAFEKSGTVHLEAGLHAIRVDCFNASNVSRLRFEYTGPNFPRRPIKVNDVGDLHYDTYRARLWMLPPNRNAGTLTDEGFAGTIDNGVIAGREYMRAVFEGSLEIREPGDYTFFLSSDDGSRLFIGPPSLRIEKLSHSTLPDPQFMRAGQTLDSSSRANNYQWVCLEGCATRASHAGSEIYFWLTSGAGQVRVEIADSANLPASDLLLNNPVRMTGVVRRGLSLDGTALQETLFVQDVSHVEILDNENSERTSLSTSARQGVAELRPPKMLASAFTPIAAVERMDRWLLGAGKESVNVRIHGVVTRVISSVAGIVLQDESRGIYVNLEHLPVGPVQIGELLEITGKVEPGEFSPFIIASKITRCGAGIMPTAIRASREELTNGSLHSQYVEIEGYVLAVDPRTVTLRTREGVLRVETETETSVEWLDTVVRMRGCLRVFWDASTRQINSGKAGLDYAEISIESAAPKDLFAVSKKEVADLRKFDPYAETFQRIRLAGQVVHKNGNELCLVYNGHGLRATLAADSPETHFEIGDLVEVAGFPEFDGPSPHIDHALVRTTGHEQLPTAHVLPENALLRDEYDCTRVSVDADLLDIGFQDSRWILQLRSGANTFRTRIDAPLESKPDYETGSRLRLTGVYRGLGGNRNLDQPIGAFEILLASPSAIRVLATPPWWTLPRLLAVVGILSVILALSLLWITSLRRQVARQTAQLETVLEERHRVEQAEALAKERSRLAYDLHDELGAGLSEIGMMSTLVASPSLAQEKRHAHLSRLTDTARRLIASLDEIVWAVNPRYDPVSSFASYYTIYAQQFLELAGLRCRLDIADDLPAHPLTSRVRHTLFLAFKETLTNVARHARATEVAVHIFIETSDAKNWLVISVSDDGCGMQNNPDEKHAPGKDGLASIAARLRDLGGACEITSVIPHGTRISLKVPLA